MNWKYPVIIDNMMNLELLFWASRETGDQRFHDIAITHADNTIKNHFRPDYSSYHVICYDPEGKVLAKKQANTNEIIIAGCFILYKLLLFQLKWQNILLEMILLINILFPLI